MIANHRLAVTFSAYVLSVLMTVSSGFAGPQGAPQISIVSPATLVSSSQSFDRACPNYYRQGNDPDVMSSIATEYCGCIASNMDRQGLGNEVLDFLGRTYSEDLTAFIDEYPNGKAWMESYFAAEEQCKKNTDFGQNQPPPSSGIEQAAGSWGGVVRVGPGQEFKRLTALQQGERVALIENTGIIWNEYPWWKIQFRGGREGYQWGGILCSLNAPIDGVFQTCE